MYGENLLLSSELIGIADTDKLSMIYPTMPHFFFGPTQLHLFKPKQPSSIPMEHPQIYIYMDAYKIL